jgi:hypothetical protein
MYIELCHDIGNFVFILIRLMKNQMEYITGSALVLINASVTENV